MMMRCLTLFGIVGAGFGAWASVEPLVTCGDFETGEGLVAPGWTLPTNGQWTVQRGGGLNGNGGLVWRSDAPAPKGVYPVQELKFRAGARYSVEAFIRTDLKSECHVRPGATVYLMV